MTRRTVGNNQKCSVGVNQDTKVGSNQTLKVGPAEPSRSRRIKRRPSALPSPIFGRVDENGDELPCEGADRLAPATRSPSAPPMNETIGGAKAEEIGGAKIVAVGGLSAEVNWSTQGRLKRDQASPKVPAQYQHDGRRKYRHEGRGQVRRQRRRHDDARRWRDLRRRQQGESPDRGRQ